MKKLVCESLQQFYLFENMQEAKKTFAELGFNEYSPEWKNFELAFEENPDLADKFAKWIEGSAAGDKQEFIEELNDTIEKINKAKEYEIPSSELGKFTTYNQFKRNIDKFLNQKREDFYSKEKEDIIKRGKNKKKKHVKEYKTLIMQFKNLV